MMLLPLKTATNKSFLIKSYRHASILFFGSDLFSKSCLKALHANQVACDGEKVVDRLEVVCLPEKRNKLPVKQYAQQQNIPVYTWPQLPVANYDIGVVVSFGKLIPKRVIQMFPYGMINVHGSILPRWRGASPFMHTILAGDDEAGISIMEIKPGKFDHGRILMLSEKVKVLQNWTSEDLGIALEDYASACLLECLKNIDYFLQNAEKQSNSSSTHAPKIKSEDCIIIWDLMDSEEIYRRYRAFGFRKDMVLRTSFDGRAIKLQKMCQLDVEEKQTVDVLEPNDRKPGDIIFLKKSKTVCVRCKSGYIGIKKLIFGKPISSNDFYNGAIQPLLKNGKSVRFE